MVRTLPYLAAMVIVLSAGVVQGLWTGRWTPSRAMAVRVAELQSVPLKVGDWEGQELSLDRGSIEMAELAGYLVRSYRNPRGDAVTMMLVCGRPGPISVHTPEICYPGNGYVPMGSASRISLPGGPDGNDELWSLEFLKPGTVTPEESCISYAWNAGKAWRASTSPRIEFAGVPVLFKMYVQRPKVTAGAGSPADPGVAFLKQMLPVLREHLYTHPV